MRFLVCSFDGQGFIFPLVGLAIELRARGHTVAFACPPSAAGLVSGNGFDRIPSEGSASTVLSIANRGTAELLEDACYVESGVARLSADVLLTHDVCYPPLLAKAKLGIPLVVLGFLSYLWPTSVAMPGFDHLPAIQRWRLAAATDLVNNLRIASGLPTVPRNPEGAGLLGDRYLLRSTPEIETAFAVLPPRVHLVGACEWEPADAGEGHENTGLTDFGLALDGSERIVYVQHGPWFRSRPFWPLLAHVGASMPERFIASVGRMPAKPGPCPPNFAVRDHVSQRRVLPRASAVVSGGQPAAIIGALSHGVPVLVLPSGGGDTIDNAARVHSSGCGIVSDPNQLTGDILQESLRALLDDKALRQQSARVARAFAGRGGFRAAAAAAEGQQAPVSM